MPCLTPHTTYKYIVQHITTATTMMMMHVPVPTQTYTKRSRKTNTKHEAQTNRARPSYRCCCCCCFFWVEFMLLGISLFLFSAFFFLVLLLCPILKHVIESSHTNRRMEREEDQKRNSNTFSGRRLARTSHRATVGFLQYAHVKHAAVWLYGSGTSPETSQTRTLCAVSVSQ